MTERAVIIADFDSGLKYANCIAEAIAGRGAEVRIAIPTTDTAAPIAAAQIANATSLPTEHAPWEQLVEEAAAADIVIPVFEGPRIERFISDVHASGRAELPVFGAGYVGMALNDLVSGYLARSLADVIAVNSRSDHARFTQAGAQLGIPTDNVFVAGLALLPKRPLPTASGPIHRVLFTDQPTVPRGIAERTYVWDRVADYARLHPDREVAIRPRHRPDESTLHRMRYSPDEWAAHRTLPDNLRIDHTPIHALFEWCDVVVTVSSTAGLEALAAGKRVAFLADVLNDAALNVPLLPSGLVRRFDDVDADRLGVPSAKWLDDVFPARHDDEHTGPADLFAERLIDVARGAAPRTHQAVWDSTFQRGRRTTGTTLETLRSVTARGRYTPRRITAGVLRRALKKLEG